MLRKICGLGLLIMMIIQGLGMMGMAFAENKITHALIVVDPGMSGFSLKVAENISGKLLNRQITAKVIKAKDFKTQDLASVELLVMGGPTYARQPSGGVKQAMDKVNKPGLKALLFVTGGRDCAGLAPLMQMAGGKGLTVIGSGGILFNQTEASYLDEQVDQLLEKI